MYGRAQTASVERLWEHVALVVGAAALTAVCAQVSFGYPVPTTLQTLAVLGSGAYLGARRGAAAQLLYLGIGAAGAPIFANGDGGLAWLTRADPLHVSGGYLWGYPLAAFAAGVICERYGRSFYVTVPAMLVGSVCLYATASPGCTRHSERMGRRGAPPPCTTACGRSSWATWPRSSRARRSSTPPRRGAAGCTGATVAETPARSRARTWRRRTSGPATTAACRSARS